MVSCITRISLLATKASILCSGFLSCSFALDLLERWQFFTLFCILQSVTYSQASLLTFHLLHPQDEPVYRHHKQVNRWSRHLGCGGLSRFCRWGSDLHPDGGASMVPICLGVTDEIAIQSGLQPRASNHSCLGWRQEAKMMLVQITGDICKHRLCEELAPGLLYMGDWVLLEES